MLPACELGQGYCNHVLELTQCAAGAGGACIEKRTRCSALHEAQHPVSSSGPAPRNEAKANEHPYPTDLQLLPLPNEVDAFCSASLALTRIGRLHQQMQA